MGTHETGSNQMNLSLQPGACERALVLAAHVAGAALDARPRGPVRTPNEGGKARYLQHDRNMIFRRDPPKVSGTFVKQDGKLVHSAALDARPRGPVPLAAPAPETQPPWSQPRGKSLIF